MQDGKALKISTLNCFQDPFLTESNSESASEGSFPRLRVQLLLIISYLLYVPVIACSY